MSVPRTGLTVTRCMVTQGVKISTSSHAAFESPAGYELLLPNARGCSEMSHRLIQSFSSSLWREFVRCFAHIHDTLSAN
jgi:predicted alpha/beta-fold hydrolase